MLTFVIPLKSKLASNSWSTVSNLFERTLRSVCYQTSANFRVIVVCHERPSIEFHHKNVEYLTADFPAPKLMGDPTENRIRKEADQTRKVWLGSVYAETFQPSHVMFVDSDDCISCNLVAYVDRHRQSNGWYIEQGFEYPSRGHIIYPKSKFYTKCGTSNIIRYDLLKPLLRDDPGTLGPNHYPIYIRHKAQRSYFAKAGNPLSPLPFPGAIYITEHGDNTFLEYFSRKQKNLLDLTRVYGGKLRKRMVAQPITREIREEFGLWV